MVLKCFDIVAQGDPEEILSHIHHVSASDVKFVWPDIGFDIRGASNIAALYKAIGQCIPDFKRTVLSVVEEGPFNVTVTYIAAGTQQRSMCLPMFPMDMFASWQCQSSWVFNSYGKVVEHRVHLALVAHPTLEPPLLHGLSQSALVLAFTAGGSRMLQSAIDVVRVGDQEVLVEGLRGHVWEASGNPHANHVLQKYITAMPPERVGFIVSELRGRVVAAAQHKMRCRVLERLIEHCPHRQTAELVEEVIGSGLLLTRHPFGNFVVQHVLEHGTPDQRHRMAECILEDIHRLARHKISSNVVRCALVHCPEDDKREVVQALVGDPHEYDSLAHHCVGSFVVRELKLLRRNGASP